MQWHVQLLSSLQMSKAVRFTILSALLLSVTFCSAQTTSFESTLKTYTPWALSLSIGQEGFFEATTPWDFELIEEGDIVHYGTFIPNAPRNWRFGLGGIYVYEDPILFDRIGLNFIGGKRYNEETFTGLYHGEQDTINCVTSAINIAAVFTVYKTFTISPDLFIETGIGGSIRRDFFRDISSADFSGEINSGIAPDLPVFTASCEALLGVGAMMWTGRFIRLNLAVDLMQLAPFNTAGETPWLMNSYRPYRVMLSWDLHRRKRGDRNCANPTHSEKAKELFGKDMRGTGKAVNKVGKKKKKRRRR